MNNPSMLMLTPGFAANEQDHNCIPVLQLLVRELLTKGVDIQIVALEYPFSGKPYLWHGAQVFPCNGQNRKWLKWRTLFRATQYSNKILHSPINPVTNNQSPITNQPITNNQSPITNTQSPITNNQILSFWQGWASYIGERVAKQHGIPHFTTLMGQDVLPSNRKHLRNLSPERCARLIAVSEFQNQMLEKTTGLRAGQVIPWGIAESEIPTEIPQEKKLDVLGVGSLIPVKNWDKWLNTIALAKTSNPNLQAELIGSGPERNRLEALARGLGIEKNLRFAGELPRAAVLARMREARVLLHTSDFESFGFVFAEAVMNGMRIVSTPVGVAAELSGACADSEAELAEVVLQSLTINETLIPSIPYTMSMVAEQYLILR
jgi:1,2-diacylglycerol 3-alpha-glucosyltransferase